MGGPLRETSRRVLDLFPRPRMKEGQKRCPWNKKDPAFAGLFDLPDVREVIGRRGVPRQPALRLQAPSKVGDGTPFRLRHRLHVPRRGKGSPSLEHRLLLITWGTMHTTDSRWKKRRPFQTGTDTPCPPVTRTGKRSTANPEAPARKTFARGRRGSAGDPRRPPAGGTPWAPKPSTGSLGALPARPIRLRTLDAASRLPPLFHRFFHLHRGNPCRGRRRRPET